MTNLVVDMSPVKLTPSNKMHSSSNAYRILLTVLNILRCDWYTSSIIFVLKILIYFASNFLNLSSFYCAKNSWEVSFEFFSVASCIQDRSANLGTINWKRGYEEACKTYIKQGLLFRI